MEVPALRSPFLCPSPQFLSYTHKKLPNKPLLGKSSSKPKFLCCLRPDPWTLSDGNPYSKNLNKPKPKSKNPKNPLTDDNARRIIKSKAQYLSVLRRNQGSRVQTPRWIKRTPEQMVQYLEDDRNGHLYGRHVVAAIKRVRSLSQMSEGAYDMREVMGSFVAKLSFREMCAVLKEQKSWRQVRDFFGWMKLQLSYRPSVIVYTLVLRAYGQVGKIQLAEQTFLEMLETGCEPDEVACGTMLCSYARWGRHKPMLSFYSAVQERGIMPSTAVFNFMLSSLQKKSRHSDVLFVWRQMKDKTVAPNQFTYTVIISSLAKQNMSNETFEAFKEMKKLGFVPEESTYSLLITLSSKCGDKDEVFHLYEDMRSKGIIPSNFTCASLLAMYYRYGDYRKACSLFTEMEKYDIIADEVIFGLMIRIYGKLGLYEEAQKTFEEIDRSSQLSDGKTFATMAQVHLRFGNFEKAIDVMEQMRTKNISYSRFSYIVLLQCYIVKGDLASAEVTYQSLLKTGPPDATSCDDMLNFYLRLGLAEKAKDLVAQIRKGKIQFDEELFKTVMKIYCKGGMLREVEQLIAELKLTKTLEDSTFFQTIVMATNGKLSKLEEIDNFFEPADQSGAMAIELLVVLYLEAQDCTQMNEILNLLLKTKIGESAGNHVISKFSREGDLLKAEYLYELMTKLGCRLEVTAVGSMISLYGKQKKLRKAQEVYSAVAGSGTTGKETVYNSMINAYITCNREEEAYFFYKEQTEKGNNLDPVSISIIVKALTNNETIAEQKASCYGEVSGSSSGKHTHAEDVIHNSFRDHLELDTVAYNTFIKAMLEAGKLRFAVSIYERMLSLNISPSIQTYNTMISVYGRFRNLDKVVEMFNMAQNTGTPLDEKTYTNLICHYGKAGKVVEASALFSKMLEEGIKPGQMCYNIIINVNAAKGLHHEAEQLFQSMKTNGNSPDSRTYLALIRAYTEGLKYSEAEQVIMSMQNEGIYPSCAHFNLLLRAFAKSGLMGEAERIYQNLFHTGLHPELECKRILLRGYVEFGNVEDGIIFFERECCSEKPDRFILSAAVHLYKSANMESRAQELLNSMESFGVPFLKNLEMGSKAKSPVV